MRPNEWFVIKIRYIEINKEVNTQKNGIKMDLGYYLDHLNENIPSY